MSPPPAEVAATNPAVNEVSPAPQAAPPPLAYEAVVRPTRFRWVILALVFFAITINYIDRNVMGLVAPRLREQFHITAKAYGYITTAFSLAYAIGQSMSGRWLDWIGTRVGYAVGPGAGGVGPSVHPQSRTRFA